MLERETDLPEGWQLYWIERTWMPLNLYLNLLSCILSFTIVVLGLAGWFIGRGASRRLKKNPSERIAITTRMHKKLEKVTKSHFAVAITYLIHAFALALVDGFIAVLALRHDFKSNGDEYDSDAWVEIGIYVVYLTVLFAASFFFVPLLQMLLVTWSLARFKKSRNCSTLADYIPEARFLSTVIAQVWCMATFYVTWTSPDGESFCSTFRFVILQACVGSSTAWLQASFAFNFCADAIENVDARSGVQNALSMFKKTAVIVYTNPSEKEKLPRYEDEPSQPTESGEKC